MFAVLHIADFALHAVLRHEPAATGQPAALFSGTGKKSLVLAANPAARALGVALGMTAPQAVARCPALVIRTPKPAAETEARAALLAVGFTLSPAIEDTAPGLCTADLKGADPAKHAPLAVSALAQLAALGLPATVGLARTPLLARYAARSVQPDLSSFSLSFSSAFDASSPLSHERKTNAENERERAGILLLSPADEESFLAPLPLAVADPSPPLAAVLVDWGLRTLGDLTALPRDEIVRRFGSEGLALWQRAAGGTLRPLHPVVPPQKFSARMEFENEIETLEPLLFILRRFLDRLALELRAAQFVAAELHLALKLEDDTRHARRFRLPEPTADVEVLFRALHTHLESLTTPAAIVALELDLTPARPLVRQQGLFETGLRDPHGFAETLARVSALVGHDRIGTPQLPDTHRPDAVQLIPPAPVIPPAVPDPLHPPLGLPLRRFRPPVPARLSAANDGSVYLWSDRVQGEISLRGPPYPASGEWWQKDRAWQRVESDIALAEGGLYRLVRVGESYFLEGEYD
ncbi:MAG TPA: DNA polymerase Y family protein [Opitutaceae bacterium]|nr:DNA polymerase Y family protein [Opitutaceae bacterium]